MWHSCPPIIFALLHPVPHVSIQSAQLQDRRRRSRLRRPAARRGVRQALPHRRLRHQGRPRRRAEEGARQHARSGAGRAARSEEPELFHRREGPEALQGLHRHGADADRRLQAPRPDADRARQRAARRRSQEGRHRRIRIHRLSRLHRRDRRADPRAAVGPEVQQRFLLRLQPGAHQSRRQAASPDDDQEDHLGLDAGSRRFRRLDVREHHQGRHAQGLQHPRRRSGQGDREHAARRQHRADQRAGADLQPPRHRYRGSAGGGRAPSGISCRSARAWSAGIASASIRTT